MISTFVPLAPPRAHRTRATRARAKPAGTRPHDALSLTWCVLAVVLLLECAVQFFPKALLLSPIQSSTTFKMVSGYSMLFLLAFAMSFGWLRRRPSMLGQVGKLKELHQLGGLLLLVLLASHVGQKPSGFLLFTFHAMAIASGAGALRTLIGRRLGRSASATLLVLHISLSCLVLAAVLFHLYFVYAYTA